MALPYNQPVLIGLIVALAKKSLIMKDPFPANADLPGEGSFYAYLKAHGKKSGKSPHASRCQMMLGKRLVYMW